MWPRITIIMKNINKPSVSAKWPSSKPTSRAQGRTIGIINKKVTFNEVRMCMDEFSSYSSFY